MLIKTGLTLTAFAAAAYSRWLGKKLEAAGVDALDHTDLADDLVTKLRRQQLLNRVIPLLSGSLVVVGAVEGERMRSANSGPTNPVTRVLEKVADTVSLDKLNAVAGTVSDKVGERVDLHKITPDFIEERRLPDAISKLAS
jgi:hypothetical protein